MNIDKGQVKMLVVVLQHGDGELGKTYLLELGKPLMGFH
jgi:hypothetical protein